MNRLKNGRTVSDRRFGFFTFSKYYWVSTRLCGSHLYKTGIAWQRRLKARKKYLMLVLDGVRQSFLGLDS